MLFFVIKFCICCLFLTKITHSVDLSRDIPMPVVTEDEKKEAIIMKEEATQSKQRYVAEAIKRSHETKDVVAKVMKESANGEQPPCLSSFGSTALTPTHGGKCSVTPIGAHPKMESIVSETPVPTVVKDEQILVFVSFSMPEASIKHLLESLKDHPEVTLVLRGLIDDSMEKTARYVADIKGVFEINPERFEEYNIQVVPTFVFLKRDVPIAQLKGNITLTHAKELFASKVHHG